VTFKATLTRLMPTADIGDTDVYCAQQYAPLLDVDIPNLIPLPSRKFRNRIGCGYRSAAKTHR
jgi:hypothetical protein